MSLANCPLIILQSVFLPVRLIFKVHLGKDKQQYVNIRNVFTVEDWLSKPNFIEQAQKMQEFLNNLTSLKLLEFLQLIRAEATKNQSVDF